MPTYRCAICDNTCDQKSHHNSHIKTKKHKDAKRILELELEKMSKPELVAKYTHSLISHILACQETIIVEEVKESHTYLRTAENKIIVKIDTDNQEKSESKKQILRMIDRAHNYLYNSENIEGEDALNDIMNLLFIKCIKSIISDVEEDGKIDLLNKKYYKDSFEDEQLTEILSYFTDLQLLANNPLNSIRNMSEPTDNIRQMG